MSSAACQPKYQSNFNWYWEDEKKIFLCSPQSESNGIKYAYFYAISKYDTSSVSYKPFHRVMKPYQLQQRTWMKNRVQKKQK